MITCFELTDMAYPIKLERRADLRFVVTYGKQVKRGLTYAEAALALGEAIMHAASLDGKLDVSGGQA